MTQSPQYCPHCGKSLKINQQGISHINIATHPHVVRVASGAVDNTQQSPLVLTHKIPKYDWTPAHTLSAVGVGVGVWFIVATIDAVTCFIGNQCLTPIQSMFIHLGALSLPTLAMGRFLDNARYEIKQTLANTPQPKKKPVTHKIELTLQTSRVSTVRKHFQLPKPLTPDDLRRVAIALEGEGARFSCYYLHSKRNAISERSFYKLSMLLRDRGLAVKTPANQIKLTRGGKAFFRSYLPAELLPTTLPTTEIQSSEVISYPKKNQSVGRAAVI